MNISRLQYMTLRRLRTPMCKPDPKTSTQDVNMWPQLSKAHEEVWEIDILSGTAFCIQILQGSCVENVAASDPVGAIALGHELKLPFEHAGNARKRKHTCLGSSAS